MKNKSLSILLCFLICVFPLLGKAQPSIVLNGLNYTPVHDILFKDNMMYVSTSDLATLTFTEITQVDPEKYRIDLGNTSITLSSNSKNVRLNSSLVQNSHLTFIKKDIFYVPVNLLDFLKIPYKLDKMTLSIGPLVPYSRNDDDPNGHTFLEAKNNLQAIPLHLYSFSSEEAVKTVLNASLESKSYLSFVDNQHFSKGSDFLSETIRRSPYNNIQVIMRKVDTLTPTPTISSFETVPMTFIPYSSSLQGKIGEDKFTYNSFWATFSPHRSLTQLDMNKSADTTLMRIIYEYYRNHFGFKDDKFFSPFTTVTCDRANALIHEAYTTDNSGNETDYIIKVHRIHPSGSMIFLVDVYKK